MSRSKGGGKGGRGGGGLTKIEFKFKKIIFILFYSRQNAFTVNIFHKFSIYLRNFRE